MQTIRVEKGGGDGIYKILATPRPGEYLVYKGNGYQYVYKVVAVHHNPPEGHANRPDVYVLPIGEELPSFAVAEVVRWSPIDDPMPCRDDVVTRNGVHHMVAGTIWYIDPPRDGHEQLAVELALLPLADLGEHDGIAEILDAGEAYIERQNRVYADSGISPM